MPGHDIIVVGASAGGVEALTTLVGDLPGDLPAAVFVVLHIPATATSLLPHILARRTTLPVGHADDGEPIEPGRIYVAPPDRHLLLGPGSVRVTAGLKENGHRPSVDLLFRSAVAAYGERAVAVVLSGTLDDGTAGLRAVTTSGGIGIVQDPEEALYPGMPLNAIEGDHPHHVLPLSDIGKTLVDLAGPSAGRQIGWSGHGPESREGPVEGHPSGYTCPECHGVLWGLSDDQHLRFRCRVGHGFSSAGFLAVRGADVEGARWTAYRGARGAGRALLQARRAGGRPGAHPHHRPLRRAGGRSRDACRGAAAGAAPVQDGDGRGRPLPRVRRRSGSRLRRVERDVTEP